MGAEERRLYNIAEDYTIKSEITNKYFDETMLMEINTDVYEGRVMLTGAVTKAATNQFTAWSISSVGPKVVRN